MRTGERTWVVRLDDDRHLDRVARALDRLGGNDDFVGIPIGARTRPVRLGDRLFVVGAQARQGRPAGLWAIGVVAGRNGRKPVTVDPHLHCPVIGAYVVETRLPDATLAEHHIDRRSPLRCDAGASPLEATHADTTAVLRAANGHAPVAIAFAEWRLIELWRPQNLGLRTRHLTPSPRLRRFYIGPNGLVVQTTTEGRYGKFHGDALRRLGHGPASITEALSATTMAGTAKATRVRDLIAAEMLTGRLAVRGVAHFDGPRVTDWSRGELVALADAGTAALEATGRRATDIAASLDRANLNREGHLVRLPAPNLFDGDPALAVLEGIGAEELWHRIDDGTIEVFCDNPEVLRWANVEPDVRPRVRL